jgi:hypothetical protein
MTRWFSVTGICLLAAPAWAATPPARLTEQGRLYDASASNKPLAGRAALTFAVYELPQGGAALWQETITVDLDDGYFSVALGETVAFPASLWNGGILYLGLKVNDDDEMSPREVVRSVPYALLASDVSGDIHPASVSVAGRPVIDSSGRWVGPANGASTPGAGTVGPPGAAGPPGPAGITSRWQGYLTGPLAPGTNGSVAHLTVRAPEDGFITVRADFLNAVRNFFDNPNLERRTDCIVSSQLASAAAPPTEGLGMARIYVNASLPTQAGSGPFQTFLLTSERSFSVISGQSLTVYLNGQADPGCSTALWFHLQMTAEFTRSYTDVPLVPN